VPNPSAVWPAGSSLPWGRVITAMATPFDAEGRIDPAGVARLVDHLFTHGSESLVVSGTTGESPVLSAAEKLRLFELVRESARGRGAVLAGVGSYDTAESAKLAREAAALGVDGLLLVTPYYNKPSQEGLYRHFRAVAEATPLPVMLYNVPPRTSVNLEARTTLRLAADAPNVVAVKEASSNLVQATEILSDAPEGFRVYSGEDPLVLPLMAIGAYGVVSVSAHLVGPDLQAMIAAHLRGDIAEAARLHAKMMPIVRALFQPTTPSPVPLKAALELMGVPVGAPRLPLVQATDAERATVRKAMQDYGLLR
jgi:4-hydroxy-tetrahydrodipicolinate synthase